MKKSVLGLMLLMAGSALASEKVTPISQSKWSLMQDSPLHCQLNHDIKSFGVAEFSQMAGDVEMSLTVKPVYGNFTTQQVSFWQVAPPWRAGIQPTTLGQLTYHSGFDLVAPDALAKKALSVLEQGSQTALMFPKNDQQVLLQPINFQNSYQRFQHCLTQLLPYRFEDIALTVIHYQSGTDQISRVSMNKLKQIKRYLELQPELTAVILSGYTDNYGSSSANKSISEKRVEALQAYFSDIGIDDRVIIEYAHGEKRFIDNNTNELGRAKNRRVVIQLKKG